MSRRVVAVIALSACYSPVGLTGGSDGGVDGKHAGDGSAAGARCFLSPGQCPTTFGAEEIELPSSVDTTSCPIDDTIDHVCIYTGSKLTVSATTRVSGPNNLAIFVSGTIEVLGTGTGTGGELVVDPGTGSAGSACITPGLIAGAGGAGGSFGTSGGEGGPVSNGVPEEPSNAVMPTPKILSAGCDGASAVSVMGSLLAGGGYHGGSLLLHADVAVNIEGFVDVSGGGGTAGAISGADYEGGGGGGAGGMVILDAPNVTITGQLQSLGGGGGGGASDLGGTGITGGNDGIDGGAGGAGDAGGGDGFQSGPAMPGSTCSVDCGGGGGGGGAGFVIAPSTSTVIGGEATRPVLTTE